MLQKLKAFLRWADPFMRELGRLEGLRFALQLRQEYKRAPGQPFPMRLRGLRHPFWVRAGTADTDVVIQLFLRHELASDYGITPKLIIDAGANIGLASVLFANLFPDARIVALEVDTANFELLRRNVQPYVNVLPLRRGLWSRRSPLRIVNPDASPLCFAVAEAPPAQAGELEGIGVSELLEELGEIRVGVLKMDIEGAEIEVLGAASDWIERVDVIVIELHDRLRPGCTDALRDAVRGRAFDWSTLGEYTVLRASGPSRSQMLAQSSRS